MVRFFKFPVSICTNSLKMYAFLFGGVASNFSFAKFRPIGHGFCGLRFGNLAEAKNSMINLGKSIRQISSTNHVGTVNKAGTSPPKQTH